MSDIERGEMPSVLGEYKKGHEYMVNIGSK